MYMQNIADYVRDGGALLQASGPACAGRLSLARTPIGDVLPAQPTGGAIEQGFRPRVTDIGARHPVTAELSGAGKQGPEPNWGRRSRPYSAHDLTCNRAMTVAVHTAFMVLHRFGNA